MTITATVIRTTDAGDDDDDNININNNNNCDDDGSNNYDNNDGDNDGDSNIKNYIKSNYKKVQGLFFYVRPLGDKRIGACLQQLSYL